ncbi:hypothetical protein FA95DRAFT_1612338 [Auriscalpium vulgare]|uniref:Uncharacterized protein n=1 Tax=Auriscalpium vulgare TaxID=40419 RepID=A0ACB8R771_9AGAM|nr:hypothetical protein FA95DRAFT_1612338 [Auriscalpium vulgare]
MSLSSFLLPASKAKKVSVAVDGDLDALFRASAVAQPLASTSAAPPKTEKKRKRAVEAEVPKADAKKAKAVKPAASDALDGTVVAAAPKSSPKSKKEKSKKEKKTVNKHKPEESDDSDDDAGLEDAYHRKAGQKAGAPKDAQGDQEDDSQDDTDSEGDASKLVHESVAKPGKRAKTRTKAVKFTPEGETSEQRDARTIFVGNVPTGVAKTKSSLKQLKRHILALVPTSKIESIRFRSVAFQNPTSKLTGDSKEQPKAADDGRAHDRERAATWRASNPADDDDKDKERKRMTTQEKKRIAFIKHELHEEADSVHAYVVFAHPAPRAANLPALQVLDPYEAARLAVEKCDGTVFMERTLRVDAVRKAEKDSDVVAGDPKRTVFVGNLDFASKEEDLRVFFEGVVSAERGARGDEDSEEEDEGDEEAEKGGEAKPKTWVTRVRIIRDKDTQLGKGFAYVQFADRQCVDEVVALEEGKLKFAKRKLRVQRCKTLPGGAKISKPSAKSSNTQSKFPKSPRTSTAFKAPPTPISIPKGNPQLGEKLAHLPKEGRKAAKAANAERVARRLAKKKSRIALAKAGVHEVKKDRERVRKNGAEKVRKVGAPREQKKGRVRSEKSVMKRNVKK